MQIMGDWYLADRWFLLLIRMMTVKTRLKQELDFNKGWYADCEPTEETHGKAGALDCRILPGQLAPLK